MVRVVGFVDSSEFSLNICPPDVFHRLHLEDFSFLPTRDFCWPQLALQPVVWAESHTLLRTLDPRFQPLMWIDKPLDA